MAKNRDLGRAGADVSESMARAVWTLVRQGADLGRDMADGALGKLGERNDQASTERDGQQLPP